MAKTRFVKPNAGEADKLIKLITREIFRPCWYNISCRRELYKHKPGEINTISCLNHFKSTLVEEVVG